jgi:hypothetical protein
MPKSQKQEIDEEKVLGEQAIDQVIEEEDEGYTEDAEVTLEAPDQTYYDTDGDEVLFPDGPKMSVVEEWKSRFGAIYLTEFDEEVFIWHTLTRKEYKDIMKVQNADQYYKEERICDKCVLYPEGYDFLKMTRGKAGIPSLIAEQVMDKSGFTARTGAYRL